MGRERELVQAELKDCIQDLVEMYRSGATLELRVADALEAIGTTVGNELSTKEDESKARITKLMEIQQEKMLLHMQKSELTERYARLLVEHLLGYAGDKTDFPLF